MIKTLLFKSRFYLLNALSLGLLFIYYFVATRAIGFGEKSDAFFASIAMTTFLSYLILALWEGFTPHYARATQEEQQNFVAHLLPLILVAGIALSFVSSLLIPLLPLHQASLVALSYTIWIITPLNIIAFAKAIVLAQNRQVFYYAIDITLGLLLMLVSVFTLFAKGSSEIFFPFLVTVYLFLGLVLTVFVAKAYAKNSKTPLPWKTIVLHSSLSKGGSLIYGAREMILVGLSAKWGGGVYTLYATLTRLYAAIVALATTPTNNAVVAKVIAELTPTSHLPWGAIAASCHQTNLTLFTLFSLGLSLGLPFVLMMAHITAPLSLIVTMTAILWLLYGIISLESIYARLIPLAYAFRGLLIINGVGLGVFALISSLFIPTWEFSLFALILSEATIAWGYFIWLRRLS